MIAAVMALMTCLGTWYTWRRHPLFSGHESVRIIGETVLMVGGAACLVYLTTRLTLSRSMPLQIGAVLGCVVLVSIGLILGIAAVATPASAKLDSLLPPTVRLVNLHRRALTRWWKATAIFFAVCGLTALIPGPIRYICGSFALIGVMMAAIGFPVGYVMARRLDRAATALELHPWLHWHYSSEEYASWSAVQVSRLQAAPAPKRAWGKLALISLILIAASLLFGEGPLAFRFACGLGSSAMIVVFVELAALGSRRAPRQLAKHLNRAAPDAYFGNDGLICDDRFITWLDGAQYLTHAAIDDRPPRSLAFTLQRIVPGAYAGPQTITIRQSVLIPANVNDTDLRQLQSALAARCPDADVQLAPVQAA